MTEHETDTEGARGEAVVTSWVDRRHHAILARGHFDDLYREGWLAHAKTLGPLPDDESLALVRAALPAATLRLSLLPPDQYCSWTYNFVDPPLNLFLAGDNGGHNITGRLHHEGVRTGKKSRLFVEMQRPKLEPMRSIIEFDGHDVRRGVQRYYDEALQMRARLFDLDNGDVVLIEGLPMVDRPWLAELAAQGVEALFNDGLEAIEERTYRFWCGCDASRINGLIRDLFGGKLEELFGDDDSAEVQCPRCGRFWTIDRTALDVPEA